jgi:hypothetical protein
MIGMRGMHLRELTLELLMKSFSAPLNCPPFPAFKNEIRMRCTHGTCFLRYQFLFLKPRLK